ncbi:MAG TPA: hypothetical protein DEB47_17730 [Citreicella sp.]|nr:hypothetical protein [Citreicella sp.]
MQTKQTPPYGLRMPDDLKRWVKDQAKQQGRSMNNLIVHLLERQKDSDAAAQK